MNILFTLTAYPPSTGGAQYHMHQLARQLSSRHSVQVVTQWDTNRTDWLLGTTLRAPSPAYEYGIDGIPVQRISLSEDTRRGLIPWVLFYYPLQGMALKYISAALAKEIEPMAESVDLIHNCRIGREGLSFASYQVAQQHDLPFVLTPVHHPRWSGWLHRYYLNLYRKADAIIVLTESERSLLSSLGVAEKRLFVTGIGPILSQNEDAMRFRTAYHLGEDPIVLFLGQKYAYKGIEPLLKAAQLVWQKHPQTRFVFIGPRTNYSEKLFENIKDNRLLELGTVDLDTKTDAIAACTLLCVPSTQESFGGVYTEAWSLGKPVIGCDIPAVAEVISHGKDGFIVKQESDSIAKYIYTLISDPAMCESMGEAGRLKVLNRYSWPRIASLTEEAYNSVIG
jgi:glycosyltransferase involved in cell wall biosynthesis